MCAKKIIVQQELVLGKLPGDQNPSQAETMQLKQRPLQALLRGSFHS